MPHRFARAFQETAQVGQFGAAIEPNVNVCLERIDISEGGIPDTSRRMTVVQQLANIVTASPHDLEPASGYRTEIVGASREPLVDSRVSFESAGKAEQRAADPCHCTLLDAGVRAILCARLLDEWSRHDPRANLERHMLLDLCF
jgi:hypothetical protein